MLYKKWRLNFVLMLCAINRHDMNNGHNLIVRKSQLNNKTFQKRYKQITIKVISFQCIFLKVLLFNKSTLLLYTTCLISRICTSNHSLYYFMNFMSNKQLPAIPPPSPTPVVIHNSFARIFEQINSILWNRGWKFVSFLHQANWYKLLLH